MSESTTPAALPSGIAEAIAAAVVAAMKSAAPAAPAAVEGPRPTNAPVGAPTAVDTDGLTVAEAQQTGNQRLIAAVRASWQAKRAAEAADKVVADALAATEPK